MTNFFKVFVKFLYHFPFRYISHQIKPSLWDPTFPVIIKVKKAVFASFLDARNMYINFHAQNYTCISTCLGNAGEYENNIKACLFCVQKLLDQSVVDGAPPAIFNIFE